MGRLLFILALFTGLQFRCISQPLDYEELFGSDWEKALQFVEENDRWMRPLLEKYKISYPVAIAVVFPELIRYSALRDKMETALLKTLYRNLGEDYADFSIGVFQVKPSFAGKILTEASSVIGRRTKALFKRRSIYQDERDYRGAIITDLEDPESEFHYIIAFLMICDKYFSSDTADDTTRIRFLATAYNTGFWKTREEIEKMSNAKFYSTKLFNTENYSYADVSLFWYNQYIQTNKR
jgi:hypothetical protein